MIRGSVGKGREEEGVEKKEVWAFLLILEKVEEMLGIPNIFPSILSGITSRIFLPALPA